MSRLLAPPLVALLWLLGLPTALWAQERGVVLDTLPFHLALEQAQREGKWLYVDVGAHWCGGCKALKKETYPDAQLGAYMNQHFKSIWVNGDLRQNKEFTKRHQITAYPTLLVFNPQGEFVDSNVGYRPARDLLQWLTEVRNNPNGQRDLKAAALAGDSAATEAYLQKLANANRTDTALAFRHLKRLNLNQILDVRFEMVLRHLPLNLEHPYIRHMLLHADSLDTLWEKSPGPGFHTVYHVLDMPLVRGVDSLKTRKDTSLLVKLEAYHRIILGKRRQQSLPYWLIGLYGDWGAAYGYSPTIEDSLNAWFALAVKDYRYDLYRRSSVRSILGSAWQGRIPQPLALQWYQHLAVEPDLQPEHPHEYILWAGLAFRAGLDKLAQDYVQLALADNRKNDPDSKRNKDMMHEILTEAGYPEVKLWIK